jgi:glycosyltransferase involved in cell wall biosynthesis
MVTSSQARVRIVVDARMLDTAGIGTYLRETLPRVVARMSNAAFTVLGDEPSLRTLLGDDSPIDVRHWRTPIYTVREQLEVRRLLPADAALFWAPHFNIPLTWRGLLAVTVHDVAHLALPQRSVARSLYARGMFGAVRRRASVVLCDSAFTEQELRRRAGDPRRAVVCHLGVAERWFQLDARAERETPYVLFVGNVKPHKNLSRLVSAFARIASRIPHRLVIAGRREGMRTIDRGVADLAASLGDRVRFTGYVSAADLEHLIAECDALVLPSLYEGFGLPPLEALACGRAVAVARAGSLPEVCGPEAEYFAPLDVDDIARALMRVATRPPDTEIVRARRRAWARRFDWDACADVTASELRAVMASTRRHV